MSDLVMSKDGDQFLDMILQWEKVQKVMREEDNHNVRIKMLLDGQDYILFFKYKGSVYGANENSRSVFSVMKNPMGEEGYKDMNFQATNLTKAMEGEPKEEIFTYKDIDKIEVLQKEKVENILSKKKSTGKDSDVVQKNTSRDKDGRILLNKDFEEL